MLKKFLLSGAAASGLLFASTTAHAAPILLIDDFTTPLSGNVFVPCSPGPFCSTGQVTANSSMTPAYDLSSGIGILDGDRELILRYTGGPNSLNAEINGGSYSHNNGSDTSGSSLLRWDGAGGNTTGDSNVGDTDPETLDLDFGLNNGAGYDLSDASLYFHLFVNSLDLSGGGVTLTLYSGAIGIASALAVELTEGDHFFDVAGFMDVGDQGFSLANITAIELLVEGGGALDVSLDIVEVVPEPLSVGLFGLGLLGLAGARRRRTA